MATNFSDATSQLNGLINILRDGVEGFRLASESVGCQDLRATFLEYSQQRERLANELQGEVARLGHEPSEDGTYMGAMHRGWMNIRSTVSSKDDSAIVSECERGEDSAKEAYEEALKIELPPTTRQLIAQQYVVVKATHDRVRAMEKAREAAAK